MENVKIVQVCTTSVIKKWTRQSPIAKSKIPRKCAVLFLLYFMLARIAHLLLVCVIKLIYQWGSEMIVGIGIDLVECNRFLDWSAFKKQRIFTKKELEYADNDNANSERHLANFWAAREAFLKAIGIGFGDDISFSDISVLHNDAGRPELQISGGAKAVLKDVAGDGARIHLSLTDQGEYCAAMVVIEAK